MISYINPICPVTNHRATLFCYSENCTQPAFACTTDCLSVGGHSEHRTALWSNMEGKVQKMIDLPLSKEELQLLEKQEKQLKIIIEQLKTISDNHGKIIIRIKQNLRTKGYAQKVIDAIKSKTTGQITGEDMAHLIKAIEND